mgnify:CR=1 FL=1
MLEGYILRPEHYSQLRLKMKRCRKCGVDKPDTAYCRHPRNKGGLQAYCMPCTNAYRKERYPYKSNPSRAAWMKTPEGKATLERAKVKWDATHPIEIKAQNKVRSAVKAGKLQKLPCEVCGAIKTHGHHDDYSKPLEVRWLCQKHHFELHRKTA